MDINYLLSIQQASDNLNKSLLKIKAKPKIHVSYRTEPLKEPLKNDSIDTSVIPLTSATTSVIPLTSTTQQKRKHIDPINVKAHILSTYISGGTAAFCTTSDQITTETYLYKLLESKHKKHLDYLSNVIDDITYKVPYCISEFKYQHTANTNIYHDINDLICMSEKCIGKICILTLKVVVYDFVNTYKKRIAGLSIKVSKVQICE